jgi:hypothetical protein
MIISRTHDLLARAQSSPRPRLGAIGRSVEGADIDLLTIGDNAPGKEATISA